MEAGCVGAVVVMVWGVLKIVLQNTFTRTGKDPCYATCGRCRRDYHLDKGKVIGIIFKGHTSKGEQPVNPPESIDSQADYKQCIAEECHINLQLPFYRQDGGKSSSKKKKSKKASSKKKQVKVIAGKKRVVYTGPKGGKYYISKGKKRYIK